MAPSGQHERADAPGLQVKQDVGNLPGSACTRLGSP